MGAPDKTNNTHQLQGHVNNLWQQPQFCDFTLITKNTSILCHKTVLSSASSYFSKLFVDSKHNRNFIDVTPLPGHILRTVVDFMYNSEYVIDDENVIELLKLSGTWNLDVLAKLCVAYMNENVTINNACMFFNLASDNVDHHKSQKLNIFIREHFTSLYESGRLSELSLKNFTTIIEHDEINVKNEDVIFSTAVQIINQQTTVEDINRCLKLIRFIHISEHFFNNVPLNNPLMKEPTQNTCVYEAINYQMNKTVRPPRYWSGDIYYITKGCLHQYTFKFRKIECTKIMALPGWIDDGSFTASHRERVVIVGGGNNGSDSKCALLLDMADNTKVKQLPDLPEAPFYTGLVLTDTGVYVVGGCKLIGCLSSIYYLPLGSDAWQLKHQMPHTVYSPLVIQHQQCIYVLGGFNDGTLSSVAQRYNIEDDTWKQCRDMPLDCSNHEAGVVVHEDKIKVFTVHCCMIYVDDTDTWTVKQYNPFVERGKAANFFVMRDQIWAAVPNDDTYSMMSYDDMYNVWKTEHKIIDNMWGKKLFC